MNQLLVQRLTEIESLLDERKRLNSQLPRNIGLWTGVGVIGSLALIGITGGAALGALPAAYGALQVGKAATKSTIGGARLHQNAQIALDERIRNAVMRLIDDVTGQLTAKTISSPEAIGVYYRLKYMDDGFENELATLAKRLNIS